ncbi:MAG: DUF3617 family protein [Pseudomonadales bacterium]
MRNLKLFFCVTLAAFFSLTAQANQPSVQPQAGLWQVESSTSLFGHVVPDLGKLIRQGPQKLQTHIDNMLRQNHARLNGDGTTSLCVSAQQIASNHYVNDQGSGCSVSTGKRIGNVIIFQTRCEAPYGFGVTTVRLRDSQHWEATSQFIVTIRGIAQQIDNTSYGTWRSESCSTGL